MLKELVARQDACKPKRRWFKSDRFDLVVWMTEKEEIAGFQLCYCRGREEHALTWTREGGYSHDRIDDGEGNPAKNQTPILVPDGAFHAREILDGFMLEAAEIDPRVRDFVAERVIAVEHNG